MLYIVLTCYVFEEIQVPEVILSAHHRLDGFEAHQEAVQGSLFLSHLFESLV